MPEAHVFAHDATPVPDVARAAPIFKQSLCTLCIVILGCEMKRRVSIQILQIVVQKLAVDVLEVLPELLLHLL